jgi:hypothetical protein
MHFNCGSEPARDGVLSNPRNLEACHLRDDLLRPKNDYQCFYMLKKTLQCSLHAVNMSVRI